MSPLEGSLCHCFEPHMGQRRRGAIYRALQGFCCVVPQAQLAQPIRKAVRRVFPTSGDRTDSSCIRREQTWHRSLRAGDIPRAPDPPANQHGRGTVLEPRAVIAFHQRVEFRRPAFLATFPLSWFGLLDSRFTLSSGHHWGLLAHSS